MDINEAVQHGFNVGARAACDKATDACLLVKENLDVVIRKAVDAHLAAGNQEQATDIEARRVVLQQAFADVLHSMVQR